MKAIDQLNFWDANIIFSWYFVGSPEITNTDLKAAVRTFLHKRKQSPADCIVEIKKLKSQLPQSKSF